MVFLISFERRIEEAAPGQILSFGVDMA